MSIFEVLYLPTTYYRVMLLVCLRIAHYRV